MARRSWRQRLLAYVSAPGVFWWGLPLTLTTAVWTHGRASGFQARAYWSVEFLIRLLVALVVGVIGGNVFGRLMKRQGVDLAVLDGKDPESPA